ncbi:MAG TPA: hypothetical protein VJU84_11730 [Pyrinomonadaceae bacterium]|nr:hypothetical protein [Pyrinomonadaceae bacterium]
MRIEPTGILLSGICEIQTEKCTARTPASITVVWTLPARRQISVCSPCIEEMVRSGEWEIESAKLRRRADVAVFDRSGNLQLVVEAKYVRPDEESLSRAVQIRRNLLAHSGIPSSPYFLIVFPSHFYLWKAGRLDKLDRNADYSADTEIMHTHPDHWTTHLQSTQALEFERRVSEWIKGLSASHEPSDVPDWVRTSGLYDAIKDGSVVTEATI